MAKSNSLLSLYMNSAQLFFEGALKYEAESDDNDDIGFGNRMTAYENLVLAEKKITESMPFGVEAKDSPEWSFIYDCKEFLTHDLRNKFWKIRHEKERAESQLRVDGSTRSPWLIENEANIRHD